MAKPKQQPVVSFVFFLKWKHILTQYEPAVRHEVFDAILDYVETRQAPTLKPLAAMAFSFIRYELDQSLDKYDAKREQCRRNGALSHGTRMKAEVVDEDLEEKNRQFYDEFFSYSRGAALEALCMNLHTDLNTLRRYALQCISEWNATGKDHVDFSDAATHLVSHIRIKMNADKKEQRSDRDSNRRDLLQSAAGDLAESIRNSISSQDNPQ